MPPLSSVVHPGRAGHCYSYLLHLMISPIGRWITAALLVLGVWLAGFFPSLLIAAEIPIIDAHSQINFTEDMDRVIRLMDKAGVSRTILSANIKKSAKRLLDFASRHPGRITPAVRTKGQPFYRNQQRFPRSLKIQAKQPGFGAMQEVLMYHAEKFNRARKSVAPEYAILPDDERVQTALGIALRKQWPLVAHIEFASTGSKRSLFMEQFEAMAASHPDHPFVLIHMGQLDVIGVRKLIERHSNVYFMTSRATPILKRLSKQPWSNLFLGSKLAPEWKRLMTLYPKRFIFAIDNVYERHWGPYYLKQISLWRKALADLPTDVAHAIAYRNAEKLWRLPPTQ